MKQPKLLVLFLVLLEHQNPGFMKVSHCFMTHFSVLRAAGAEEAADVDLFSLVNILTVAMVGTRPTAHRMGLMAKYVFWSSTSVLKIGLMWRILL